MAKVHVVGVRPRRVAFVKRLLEQDPWRKELQELLLEYVSLALVPTAYGLRQVIEVFQELRDLMLLDGIDHSLVGEAMEHLKRWVECAKRGEEFDLGDLLKALRVFAEELDEGWLDNGGKG